MSSEILTKNINRRDFLVLMTITPLIITSAEANPLLIGFGLRWLAKEFVKYQAKKRLKSKLQKMTKQYIKEKNVNMVRTLQVTGVMNEVFDPVTLVADEVWSIDKPNTASLLISNETSYTQSTQDIYIQLRDEENGNIDIKAKIEPINIPAKSNLVLDVQFSDLKYKGIKRLGGTYDNGKVISDSGRILVIDKVTYGKSVEEYYRRYRSRKNHQPIYY